MGATTFLAFVLLVSFISGFTFVVLGAPQGAIAHFGMFFAGILFFINALAALGGLLCRAAEEE